MAGRSRLGHVVQDFFYFKLHVLGALEIEFPFFSLNNVLGTLSKGKYS